MRGIYNPPQLPFHKANFSQPITNNKKSSNFSDKDKKPTSSLYHENLNGSINSSEINHTEVESKPEKTITEIIHESSSNNIVGEEETTTSTTETPPPAQYQPTSITISIEEFDKLVKEKEEYKLEIGILRNNIVKIENDNDDIIIINNERANIIKNNKTVISQQKSLIEHSELKRESDEQFISQQKTLIEKLNIDITKLNKQIENQTQQITHQNIRIEKHNNNENQITLRNLKNEYFNSEKVLNGKIESLKEENKSLHFTIRKLNQDITQHTEAISKLNFQLNEKDLANNKLNEIIKFEMDKRAENTSNFGMANKSKETTISNQLPMAVDIPGAWEIFINNMNDYYVITPQLDNIEDDVSIADALRVIFFASLKSCLDKFTNNLNNALDTNSPNEEQQYNFRCMVYLSIDQFIKENSKQVFEQLYPFLAPFHQTASEFERGEKFIYDCCKFIWTVLLSQPKLMFRTEEYDPIDPTKELKLYSKDNHKSFGPVNGEMCVQLTIVPSIILVRDNSVLTKSYVLLKPITNNTPITQSNSSDEYPMEIEKSILPIYLTSN